LELHPLNFDKDLIDLYGKYKIKIIAYSPLGSLATELYSDEKTVESIRRREKMNSYTNVLINFLLNQGINVCLKSTNLEHLKINLSKFKLSKESLDQLYEMNIYSPMNSDTSNSMIANGELG
jgi:diketogulonate reductase-like aldo/keto reductase